MLKQQAVPETDKLQTFTQRMVDQIFSFSELGFQEYETSRYLTEVIEKNNFKVERGIAGIPTAWTATQNATATVTATSVKDSTKSASTTVNIIAPGAVTTTTNAQVAQYSISVPDGLSVFVQFNTDTSYSLMTWSVPAPSGGGNVPVLVAGMKVNTQYHMRAVFQPTGTTTKSSSPLPCVTCLVRRSSAMS